MDSTWPFSLRLAGPSPGRLDPEAVEIIASAQDVLGAAIRRAIEDADFRAKFADDDTVRAAFPTP